MPFKTFLGRLKVKVTLEGHINELFMFCNGRHAWLLIQ